MIKEVYKDAIGVIAKKPFRLWGISLLSGVLSLVFQLLFGVVPGVAMGITMLMSTGMMMVYLHGLRGEEVQTVQLFDCFRDWATIKRVLCGLGWKALWIFLWALIPIAGIFIAIVKAYAWRLTPYILVTEPDVAPTQAIKVSEQRTMGHKGEMFLADFCAILVCFLGVFVLGLFARIPIIGLLFSLCAMVFTLATSLLGGLFLGLVQADFYEKIMAEVNSAAETAAATRVCPNCGASVVGGAFCPACGTKLEE